MKEQHLAVLKEMGFNTDGREYEDVVGDLIEEHIKIMMEVEKTNKQVLVEGVRRLCRPTN